MEDLRIIPKDLKKKLDSNEDIFLIDVRNPNEHEIAKIKGSRLIPISKIQENLDKIPKDREIIVYCHHGIRSYEAAKLLKEKGFNVRSLVGGIDVWSRFIDNKVPQY